MTEQAAPWSAPDGLYFRYGAALHDADTHSCQDGEGAQYSILLGAITAVRDEEMEGLRRELAGAKIKLDRIHHAVMNQTSSPAVDEVVLAILGEATVPTAPHTAEAYPRRYRCCWFGDKLTHAARVEGINNSITACGRWVGDKRIDDQVKKGRNAPVTCPDCQAALTASAPSDPGSST